VPDPRRSPHSFSAEPGRRQDDAGASRPGLAAPAQRRRHQGRLAVHYQGRPHQAP